MATTTSSNDILAAFRAVKSINAGPLRPLALEQNSAGTRDLALSASLPLSNTTGYWQTPADISTKPIRWIIHIDAAATPPTASLGKDPTGALLAGATTPGYVNNRQGKSVILVCRLLPLSLGQRTLLFLLNGSGSFNLYLRGHCLQEHLETRSPTSM